MNAPELDCLIKDRTYKYVPSRPVRVSHCGVIVLLLTIIGVLYLPSTPPENQFV